jgi:peptide deformylase
MPIRPILIEPDPILRVKSEKVKKVDAELKKLMKDMLDTMYKAPGIGLAAIQIGVPKRVIVIDLVKDGEQKNPMYFVNPEITWRSKDESSYEEGCLSLPGHFAEIKRPASCHVDYLDYEGKSQTLKAEGLLATCIQHEIDHLNGILFIDYLSKLKKSFIIKKLIKLKKEKESNVDKVAI